MEDRVLIFIVATVVVIGILLALYLPPLSKKDEADADKQTESEETKKR